MDVKCLRCSYEWRPFVSRPRKCPRCGSYLWDEAKEDDELEKQPSSIIINKPKEKFSLPKPEEIIDG